MNGVIPRRYFVGKMCNALESGADLRHVERHLQPLAFAQCARYSLPMRKYLDIPLTAFVAITLSVAMLWPLEAPPPAPEGSDKLVHLIAFAALAFPLARTGRLGLVVVFICASAFGGLIELIQPSFNRSADIGDWVADTIGVAIGIGCGLLYRRLRHH
jgi:hypothetical protein